MKNADIIITRHAAIKFVRDILKRQDLTEDEQFEVGKNILSEIWKDSVYVNDNENGIVFYNSNYRLNLLIKGRKMITIFYPKKRG